MPWLRTHWFLLGLLIALLCAWCAPHAVTALGLAHAQPWLIAGVFLIGGLVLPTRELIAGAAKWRLHITVQAISLGLIPLTVWLMDPLWRVLLPDALRLGLLVTACMPTSIASCFAFTRAAGGDAPVALCNATIGNVLGVLLSPWLVLWLTGRHAEVSALNVLTQLGWLVLTPIMLGQVLRLLGEGWLSAQRERLLVLSNVLLLVLVLRLFGDAFAHGSGIDVSAVAMVAAIAGVGIVGFFLVTAMTLKSLGFSRSERLAGAICASQKTAALGVPVVAILSAGDPRAALLSVPLLTWHVLQVVLTTIAVPRLRVWVVRSDAE